MFQGIDHVVIAVADLQRGIEQYEAIFGVDVSRTGEPPGAGFKNAYFDFEHTQVELVSPTDDTGPVGRRIAASGEGNPVQGQVFVHPAASGGVLLQITGA